MPIAISTRTIISRIAILAVLFTLPVAARAQSDSTSPRRWELRIPSGALLPIGEQRQYLQRGTLTAFQASWLPRASLAVTGTVGWAKSRDLATLESPRLNAFAVDVGVEARPSRWAVGRRVSLSPFVGIGAGARSYDYRGRASDAQHNMAGYTSLGGELGVGRVGLRVEVREYVSGYAPMTGAGARDVRSDAIVMAAVRFNRRAPAAR